ncbi:MAG: glutamine--fructose-6-phosphate transaminase (isomerizing) [Desulfonatronovibrionaceae bacterium]
MCGIIGYTGHRPAVPLIIEGLRRLEYRGYDSSGLAYTHQGKIQTCRAAGKLHRLEDKLAGQETLMPTCALGHTRWATHGVPNESNAHPHLDATGELAMVHNGIIENYRELKENLARKGYTFSSDTDTEVLVQLIGDKLKTAPSVAAAVAEALRTVRGAFAIVLICSREPGRIWACRNSSPLLLGTGTGENFVASDIPAFLRYTREVVFLEDGELVEMDAHSWKIYTISDLQKKAKKTHHIEWDVQAAQKDGYKHFMLKEIFEQPKVINDCLSGRLDRKNGKVLLDELDEFPVPSRMRIVACGTSFHAGLWAKYILEKYSRIPVDVDIASEFRYRDPVLQKDELVLAISQSGETADTLAGIRLAREEKARVLGLCNVLGSSVARESDQVLYTQAGPEISVASTKAMCSQMITLYLLAVYWGKRSGVLDPETVQNSVASLQSLPDILEAELPRMQEKASQLVREYAWAGSFFFLGRGAGFPLALEGALKLKEISYIHAEGYAAGEMKHGPIALIEPDFPTLALVMDDQLMPKVISNLQEVRARDGRLIVLTNTRPELEADHIWEIPKVWGPLNAFLALPALQLFAYEAAVYLGKDVDQPRNLAKSVTVE